MSPKYHSSPLLFVILVLQLHLLGNLLSYSTAQQGIATSYPGCGRRDGIKGDIRTVAPWVAAIYTVIRPSDPLKFVITGTILSPTTILTLFGGAYGSPPRGATKDYHIANPLINIVGAGMKSIKLEENDQHFQLVQVSHILPYSGHEPENKEFHYFIYHLRVPLNLTTPYVRAACIPTSIADVPFNTFGTKQWQFLQAGFAYPPKPNTGALHLDAYNMTTVPEEQCSSAFRYYYKGVGMAAHIFCARASSDETYRETCFPHGSPVAYEMESKWYLGGITALIPGRRRAQCNTNNLYMYSKTYEHSDWMKRNIECGPTKYACGDGSCIPLTKLCNGIPNCKDNSDEDHIYCEASQRCPDKLTQTLCYINGKCIKKTDICNGKKDCYDGSDEDKSRCSQLKSTNISPKKKLPQTNITGSFCYSIPNSEGIARSCTYNNEKIDCENSQVGSWITLSCQTFYISKYRIKSITMECKENGFWQPFKPFDCEPNCGLLSSDTNPLISHGMDVTKKVAFPWHAAIFKRNEGGSDYEYICGASLIEKNALFTTGHCVHEIHNNPKASELYQVVLAPLSSNYDEDRSDIFSQIFNIKRVWVPPSFDLGSITNDIAIIQLTTDVKYGNHIRPVCYLTPGGNSLPAKQSFGKVAGFGKTEKGEFSYTLKYTSLPVVDNEKCIKDFDLESAVANTFCAGNINETTLCHGDSGNGLVFADKKGPVSRYTIKGIAITSSGNGQETKDCGKNKYSIFTHVDAYTDWIYDILETFTDN